MKKNIFLFVFFTMLTLSPLSLFAVEDISHSCPFYDVRGVSVEVKSRDAAISLGSEASFTAIIQNKNVFPVSEGSLLVRIESLDGKIYDEFFASEHMGIIGAGESISTDFSWKVPTFARSGVYTVKTYFLSAGQFYLGGLIFIDGLTAGEALFVVVGENKEYVEFDPMSLRVNAREYRSNGGSVISATGTAVVSVDVRHNFKVKTDALVTWRVYKGDVTDEKNLVESSVEAISLVPGSVARSSSSFSNTEEPSYHIVGELEWRDVKSIVKSRIVRTGVSGTVIQLLALSDFPATTDIKMVGCMDNIFFRGSGAGMKTLSLKAVNEKGVTVFSEMIELPRYPIIGFSKKIPSKQYRQITLSATVIEADGSVSDEAEVVYKCNELSGKMCGGTIVNNMEYIYVFVTLFGALVLAIIAKSRGRKTYRPVGY